MASFIIKDVLIFPGEGQSIPNGFVHVENGTIKTVGSGSPPQGGSETLVISKPGHTLLPGFIDAHIHADKGNVLAPRQALRFGVTTVMDMHNEPHNVKALKKLAAEDTDVADFKSAGVAATIKDGWPEPVITAHDKSEETAKEVASWPKLKDPSEAEAYVKENIANGADYIKLMHESGAAMGAQFTLPSIELQKALIEAAHKAGKVAVAHALAQQDTIAILKAGINGLTHTFYDSAPTEELVKAYKDAGAWCNPTLAAIGSLTTEGKERAHRFAHDKRVEGLIGDQERERMCMCMDFKKETSKLEYAYESVRALKRAGVDVIVGSDSAGPALGTAWGLSLHHELSIFANECGFTPAEALRSATALTARLFGFSDRGRIAEGLKADLLLIEGNVLEDINRTLDIRGVWRDGILAKRFGGSV